jgi:uncharacterized membrane protein YphA (DoxX/SURF4 family)
MIASRPRADRGKVTKAGKPFSDYSYDLLLVSLSLLLLVTGPGAFAIDSLLLGT